MMTKLSSKRHPAEYLILAHSKDKPAGMVGRERVTLQRLLYRLEQNSDESESRKLTELIQIVEAEQRTLAGSLPMPVLKELAGKLASTTPRQNRQLVRLENELNSAREELVFRENQNNSLQTSLHLLLEENGRLSSRLKKGDAAEDTARSHLQQITMALKAAEAHIKLIIRLLKFVEKREAEADELKVRREATSLRTAEHRLDQRRHADSLRGVTATNGEREAMGSSKSLLNSTISF